MENAVKEVAPDQDNIDENATTGTADALGEPELPKEALPMTPEEQQAAAVKSAVEASGVFHLNTLFNQMLKTAQEADDAIKTDARTELWTLPQIEELFFSLRGK